MNSILVLGAGRSATSLIEYLISKSSKFDWYVTVADLNEQLAKEKTAGCDRAEGILMDILDERERSKLIGSHRVVISMLPPHLHLLVAQDCLKYGSHLLTASYLPDEIKQMDSAVTSRNLLFLNEMGLDPGLDHMSAMLLKNKIEDEGGQIFTFCSYTGGLISPESDTNPWHYKITWNPRNVVLAGQDTAVYREHGEIRFLPYQQLFHNCREVETIGGNRYEMYPNRNSLKYCEMYGLENVKTLIRGTLRHPGFCAGWSALVRLGLTDDKTIIESGSLASYRSLLAAFLPIGNAPIKDKISQRLGFFNEAVIHQILWLFDDNAFLPGNKSVAEHLQDLVVRKWKLEPLDRDLVVMHHHFEYEKQGRKYSLMASLTQRGASSSDTAMTRLVGLPMAVSAELLLTGKWSLHGVRIPVHPEIYKPVLIRLKDLGVHFNEQIQIL